MGNPLQRFAQCCSVPRDTLQGAPIGQKLLAPALSKEGQSPRRASPGDQLGLKVSLDCHWTQVWHPGHLPWFYLFLLICHL